MNFVHAVFARIVRALMGGLAWTFQVEKHNWEHVISAMESGRPVIFATWHGNILSVLLLRLHVQLPLLITMISRSRDGDLVTQVARTFGVLPVRGSSSRGGMGAMLQFRNQVKGQAEEGAPVASIHLIDGPRGPRHQAKPGIFALARQSDALIIPVLTGAQPCFYANSWDRHAIPLPFARCSLRFGAPIDIRPKEKGTGQEEGAAEDEKRRTEALDDTMRELAMPDPLIEPTLSLAGRKKR